jgi:hypothetical protein
VWYEESEVNDEIKATVEGHGRRLQADEAVRASQIIDTSDLVEGNPTPQRRIGSFINNIVVHLDAACSPTPDGVLDETTAARQTVCVSDLPDGVLDETTAARQTVCDTDLVYGTITMYKRYHTSWTLTLETILHNVTAADQNIARQSLA